MSRHDKQIEELRQEGRELTGMVHRLVMEVNRLAERQTSEREKMQLWVENQMLRFERRLPPAHSSEGDSSTEKEQKSSQNPFECD